MARTYRGSELMPPVGWGGDGMEPSSLALDPIDRAPVVAVESAPIRIDPTNTTVAAEDTGGRREAANARRVRAVHRWS
jgi:hypothetical protein